MTIRKANGFLIFKPDFKQLVLCLFLLYDFTCCALEFISTKIKKLHKFQKLLNYVRHHTKQESTDHTHKTHRNNYKTKLSVCTVQ